MCRAIVILLIIFSNAYANHDACDLSDTDFPNSSCSFTSLGIDAHTIKFGKIDDVTFSGEVIFLNSARYELESDVIEIFDVDSTDDCDYGSDELSNSEEREDIAFTVDINEPRKITKLWLLRCSVYKAR